MSTKQSPTLSPPLKIESEKLARLSDFAASMKAPLFVAEILYNQKIVDTDEARSFFIPKLESTHDANEMLHMDIAVKALIEIQNKNEKIVVHGDYDVDGITGTALLYQGLKECGFTNIDWFIPNRFKEGYGLSCTTIQSLHNDGAQWIITVDTGISANEEVAFAKTLGMKVIICDHHQQADELPEAEAIVNPNRKDCNYPEPLLSGVGVAWKLLDTLMVAMCEKRALHYLDYVVLGTIADLMPLVGENRFLVKRGIHHLLHTPRPGLKALVERSGMTADHPRTQDVSFKITPLINAAGRMGDPALSFKLITAETDLEAKNLLKELEDTNELRRKVEANMSQKAMDMVEENEELKNSPVLVVAQHADPEKWNQGVIGIVASRLIEAYLRPVAVLSIEKSGEVRASCRSIEGFNWHRALTQHSHLLNRFGGHYYAAGFSTTEPNIEPLREALIETAKTVEFVPEVPVVETHHEVKLKDICVAMMEWMKRLEPFGPGNEQPVFYAKGVRVGRFCMAVGKKAEHLRISLAQETAEFECIGFFLGDLANDMSIRGDELEVAFYPTWNTFRNKRKLQLQILALKSIEKD